MNELEQSLLNELEELNFIEKMDPKCIQVSIEYIEISKKADEKDKVGTILMPDCIRTVMDGYIKTRIQEIKNKLETMK